ncbi:hypothetical protein Tco_1423550, partial [Tanacetum coccineum]
SQDLFWGFCEKCEFVTSPLRSLLIPEISPFVKILFSPHFLLLPYRRCLMSLGLVIPCMNPEILMHSEAPLTSLLSA